jgi:hypothetical protein
LTLHYDEGQLPPGTVEAELTLQRYDEDAGAWVPLVVISRNLDADQLVVALDHFSEFALLVELEYRLFMPLITR